MNIILGAGLSGLIAGALNAGARIYERNPRAFTGHRAVLRFRDDKIARALGIDFRRVVVRKGIWHDNAEVVPTPRYANWYSRKVRGILGENSIWNMESAERFIAPDDLHARLAEICGDRVHWEHEVTDTEIGDWIQAGKSVTSTMPLPVLMRLMGIGAALEFSRAPIYVDRYRVAGCDVHQTMYFPDMDLSIYRATITGELLTIEHTNEEPRSQISTALDAFGLLPSDCEPILQGHKQAYGKITPVNDVARKALLHRLTVHFGIYSLGRFATWRNILLDDVYEDIFHIRKMIGLTQYEAHLERMKS